MSPGDIIIWEDPQRMASAHKWRVVGIHLGAVGEESLIEMESLTHKPGNTGEWEWHPRVFVPEVLVRHLKMEPKEAVA